MATAKVFCLLFPCLLAIHCFLLAQDLCSQHLNLEHSADMENMERIYAAGVLSLSPSNIPDLSLQSWALFSPSARSSFTTCRSISGQLSLRGDFT